MLEEVDVSALRRCLVRPARPARLAVFALGLSKVSSGFAPSRPTPIPTCGEGSFE